MSQKITAKRFTSNVIISLTVQVISLAVGFLLNLIVPRFIDEYQYAYWQSYVLYVGYVGILHFGLLDGLVLRYSQYDYEELDKARVRSQFVILLLFTAMLAVISIIVALIALSGPARYVVIFVGIGIISKNFHTYNSYTFQITNRINKYAVIVIAQRVSYGAIVAVLLLLKVNDFRYYCMAELGGDVVAILLAMIFNKGMYFGKALPVKDAFSELKLNIAAGIVLMLANLSAGLIVGSAKMIIQWRWDELVFGKVSFAFSLSSVFLTFVTAISVVLFPSLKRLDPETLPALYKKIRNAVSIVLFFVLIFYFPGCYILNLWIPKYAESLKYLGYLLPLIIFSSKVSLLTNNYLKVYRKEKQMMVVNLCSVAVGVLLFALCAYVINNVIALLCSIVFVIMLNSVASEVMVFKIIGQKVIKEFIVEAIMCAGFIMCATMLSLWIGLAAYAALYIIYLALNYKSLKSVFDRIKSKLKGEAK